MRLTLGCTLVLLTGLWLTNALMYFRHMNLDPASVVAYYCGNEALFMEPRTYGSMLEVTHIHLPMMALVLLLLTHLAIFLPWSQGARAALIVGTFAFALGGETAGWLVRFVSPRWALLKVLCFIGLEGTLAVLLLGLALYLLGAARAAAPRGAAAMEMRGEEYGE
ncbi:MAG: hypothetical protein ACREOU_15320 [Candidatus Eiseniibacteriota bacterium]